MRRGPLLVAAGWIIRGADGPVERRDPVQVPAFVAEESGTRDQARTLVLDSSSAARVRYVLVRGSGARLGDAELASADGENKKLDKVVANLVAGSGADQADQLGGFAVRYVLVSKGAPREVSRVLDATTGLSRLSQQDGSALWRVDQQVSRAAIVPASGAPESIAAGPVEVHTTVPAGDEGRLLRLADSADAGWTATLDGKPLTRTTVDGWAQGFRLPADGGRLDVTFDAPLSHTAWLWAQGALALVLVVLALPGRRRDIDDDLPEEQQPVTAEDMTGDGRRARRLRAQAEAEAESGRPDADPESDGGFPADADTDADEDGEIPAVVPHQQAYGEWDSPSYANAEYDTYGGEQYEGQQEQQGYPAGTYQQPYQADPYQGGQYDPYAYGGTAAYDQNYGQGYDADGRPFDSRGQGYETGEQGYDPAYDPRPPHGNDSERPDGSHQ